MSGVYKKYLQQKYKSKRKEKIICCWLITERDGHQHLPKAKRLLDRPVCSCVDRSKPFSSGGTIFPNVEKDCIKCFWRDRQGNEYAVDDTGHVRRRG